MEIARLAGLGQAGASWWTTWKKKAVGANKIFGMGTSMMIGRRHSLLGGGLAASGVV